MKKNLRHAMPLISLIVASALSLSGCGASKATGGSSLSYIEETAAASGEYGFNSSSLYDGSPTDTEYDSGGGQLKNEEAKNSSEQVPETYGRKLIRTVNLTVETDTFDELMKSLQNGISALSGYIEQTDISGSSTLRNNIQNPRYASMTVRAPSDKLDQFVGQVEEGGNVTNKSETTEDVTLQYSDLESRKKTLTMEQDRIWALLEKADSLDSVIALEARLSEIRYELESMESRLRLYDNQVQYSTVYLYIHEVKHYTPTSPKTVGERISDGFLENAEAMGVFLVDLFVVLAAGLPIWLPILILILIILFILRKTNKGGIHGCPFKRKTGKGKNAADNSTIDQTNSRSDNATENNGNANQ